MKILTKIENRYRSISVNCWNFPDEVDLYALTFVGYLKHNGISKTKALTIWDFDTISYLKKTDKGFIHAVALRNGEKFNIVIK